MHSQYFYSSEESPEVPISRKSLEILKIKQFDTIIVYRNCTQCIRKTDLEKNIGVAIFLKLSANIIYLFLSFFFSSMISSSSEIIYRMCYLSMALSSRKCINTHRVYRLHHSTVASTRETVVSRDAQSLKTLLKSLLRTV